MLGCREQILGVARLLRKPRLFFMLIPVRLVGIAVAILAVTMLGSTALWACSCGKAAPSRCGGLGKDAVIFVGTVIEIENPPSEDPKAGQGGTARYRFSVDETFIAAPGSGIDIDSGRGGPACSYHFRQGVRYLVFAYKSSLEGATYASSCS